MLIVVLILLCCSSQTLGEILSAAVMYYSDTRGLLTIDPPHARTGFTIGIKGSCALPELIIQVRNKSAGLPSRQVSCRLNGRRGFDITYLLKDGIGDYEVIIFGKKAIRDRSLKGLCTFAVRSDREMPKSFKGLYINDQIVASVKSMIGKRVGSGECWDLVQEVLDINGADWGHPLNFGELLDPDKDLIKTGDIIQFKAVTLVEKFPSGAVKHQTIGAPDHTAVIIGVAGTKIYRLAEQNSDGKRFVITSTVNCNAIISGTYRIYRPVAGIINTE
ncbi:MAG: hypothetical protein A2176_05845 [Spirochaetes bacterium RBG_13_51_14]|nr:MAG: hypothetical protein A2176_05845 [Spirochaetes bacterium RBG_13_51_14]